jgi:GT2 family glycosyltransferase
MMEVFVEPGIERPRWLRGVLAETRRSLMPSALLIRREVLDRVGGFDPRFEVGEDGDLMLRMKESGVRMGSVDRVLFRYRIHDANSLHDREHHRKALFRVIHESVKRKRRLPGAQA